MIAIATFISYYTKWLTYPDMSPIKEYATARKNYQQIKPEQGEGAYIELLAKGTIVYFCVMVIFHVYVNLSMFPNTGLPLPLFSQGGSSLMINMAMLGVLFNLTKTPDHGWEEK